MAPRSDSKVRRKTTHLSHAGQHKKRENTLTPLTRKQQQHSSSRFWSCRENSSTGKAPSTDNRNDDRSNSRGNLRRPGEAAPTREATPAPGPMPVAQVVQRGLLPRVYPPSFELERSMGPKGRHSYSTTTNLKAIDFTCFRCNDRGVVGNCRSATGLG